ncbi:hypothetical protein G3M48_008432 [Beauveria asiatica]|uniref:Uncharacterized protein n=1 Tax=Beauveria asiatica TaxID=1069075 RepID=A0AAW0RKF3_9HYPO
MNGTSSSSTIYCTVKILENEDRRKPAHEKRSAKRKAKTTAAAWPVPSARRLKASRSRLTWARVLCTSSGRYPAPLRILGIALHVASEDDSLLGVVELLNSSSHNCSLQRIASAGKGDTDRWRLSFCTARQPVTQWHINALAEYVVQNLYRYVDALRSSVGARWLMGKQRTPHAYAKAAERGNKKRQATEGGGVPDEGASQSFHSPPATSDDGLNDTNDSLTLPKRLLHCWRKTLATARSRTPTPDEAVVSGPLALAVHWHNRYLGPEPGLFRGVGAAGFVKVTE